MAQRGQAEFAETDYVIVGGGTAGAVLAARLSEDPATKVTLIEAGGDGKGLLVQLPVGFLRLLVQPETDWSYPQDPDPTLNGRSWIWSAGRMLGGSSSINGQVYIRGVRHDFDEWAELGATGWGFDEVFPYFLRSEQWDGPPSQAHGSNGPVSVIRIRDPHPLCGSFLQACAEIGLPTLDEYNDGSSCGAFLTQTNQRNGWRCSTEKGYLRPARKRPNLRILTGTEVETVQITDGRATGVVVRQGGERQVITALREVLVSAGTMGSPALLLRSGIGPAADLRQRGIAVVHDAPGVGSNLQEHSASSNIRKVNVQTLNDQTGPIDMIRHFAKFLWNRSGPLGSPAIQAMAFATTRPELAWPDIQLHFAPMVYAVSSVDTPYPVRMGMPVVSAITINVSLCKPKARGRVVLGDDLKARIQHQALGHPDDVRTLIDGLRLVDRLFDSQALAPIVTGPLAPSPRPTTDDQWTDYLRESLSITWHAAGTCRMGSDAASVVDPQLRVRGVAGLRVVDASVMPTTTSGNTNAATIMIGEKAAELIRAG